MTWQPTASLDKLKARARLNHTIREFFASRDVLEVETPLLCRTTATDPYLASFTVPVRDETLYLQTSPEFPMKRLLAAGAGPIYQLCKAFRYEESGRLHNPEFSLLEWYRPGWTLPQLVDEVEDLVKAAALAFEVTLAPFPRLTYRDAWHQTLGLDPHRCSNTELLTAANQHINGDFVSLDRNGLLDLLMSHVVEPWLPESGAFVVDFPASQAALAGTRQLEDGCIVAQRAELYLGKMEIANGYQELTDAAEQQRRFEADIDYRERNGLSPLPLPSALVDALTAGLPASAGVALGVDRLLMFLSNANSLDDVLSFTTTLS